MTSVNPEPKEWHFDFSEVRAFRLNWDEKQASDGIIVGENLNESRTPVEGILMSDQQVEDLRHAILNRVGGSRIGGCRYPHHAFVFYSSQGEVVGHYDICFLCSNAGGFPKGFNKFPRYNSLKALIVSLGMPIKNPGWD